MRLDGTEAISIELSAVLPSARADAFAKNLPPPLSLERDADGGGVASILVLEMRGLGLRDVPLLPRFDYREVLWRVGVCVDGEPAWLAVRCDLDRAAMRAMAARVIRYPVHPARIELHERDRVVRLHASADGKTLAATLTPTKQTASQPPRRTFVVQRRALFEIPWGERTNAEPWLARVSDRDSSTSEDVFGARVELDGLAVVHHARTHLCGSATRFTASSA